MALLGGGSLFVKTHPNSPWIWADHVLSPDEAIQRTVCVIAKEPSPPKPINAGRWPTTAAPSTLNTTRLAPQVWVSVWGTADTPGQTGEIVIYDDATLEEVGRIPDLITPTGKFNVYNTVHDIY
jgi:nitrite reductase (NO-forming)/hydroxylamine reductase